MPCRVKGLLLLTAVTLLPLGFLQAAETESLVQSVLAASGDSTVEDSARVVREIRDAAERFGIGRTSFRDARKLHRALHKRHLVHYDENVDDLRTVVDAQRFNCLSGSMFYALVAREIGFEVEIVETPGHLFLRLGNGVWKADVETTSSYGFDAGYQQRAALYRETAQERYLRWHSRSAPRRLQVRDPFWPVPLDRADGFAWLNRAWSELEAGRPAGAAAAVGRAAERLPDLVERAPGASLLLERAWTAAYEAGRFAEALEIAKSIQRFHPQATSTQDRILAAATQQARRLAEGNDPEAAAALMETAPCTGLPDPERVRLQRAVAPLVAAAAVRVGDFELARTMAGRYADSEPDPVEAARLAEWVEHRASDAGHAAAACDATLFSFILD